MLSLSVVVLVAPESTPGATPIAEEVSSKANSATYVAPPPVHKSPTPRAVSIKRSRATLVRVAAVAPPAAPTAFAVAFKPTPVVKNAPVPATNAGSVAKSFA